MSKFRPRFVPPPPSQREQAAIARGERAMGILTQVIKMLGPVTFSIAPDDMHTPGDGFSQVADPVTHKVTLTFMPRADIEKAQRDAEAKAREEAPRVIIAPPGAMPPNGSAHS